jgi:hypothetical protein
MPSNILVVCVAVYSTILLVIIFLNLPLRYFTNPKRLKVRRVSYCNFAQRFDRLLGRTDGTKKGG